MLSPSLPAPTLLPGGVPRRPPSWRTHSIITSWIVQSSQLVLSGWTSAHEGAVRLGAQCHLVPAAQPNRPIKMVRLVWGYVKGSSKGRSTAGSKMASRNPGFSPNMMFLNTPSGWCKRPVGSWRWWTPCEKRILPFILPTSVGSGAAQRPSKHTHVP